MPSLHDRLPIAPAPRQQPVNVGLAGILRPKPPPHCGVDRQLGRALVQAGRHEPLKRSVQGGQFPRRQS